MRKFMYIQIVFFSFLLIVVGIAMYNLQMKINTYQDLIGKTVIIDNDTLRITNSNWLYESVSLSDGTTANTTYVLKYGKELKDD